MAIIRQTYSIAVSTTIPNIRASFGMRQKDIFAALTCNKCCSKQLTTKYTTEYCIHQRQPSCNTTDRNGKPHSILYKNQKFDAVENFTALYDKEIELHTRKAIKSKNNIVASECTAFKYESFS